MSASHDEVDAIVAAWRRERPDLPVAPMEVWSRIKRLDQLLDSARARAYAAHDLEVWEFDVLSALRRSGEPYRLTPGQLLTETHVTSGTMTNRVNRLVERGLVSRTPHDQDGRVVLVGLTDRGRVVVDAAVTSLLDTEQEMIDGLGGHEMSALVTALRTLLVAQSSDHEQPDHQQQAEPA